MTRTADLKAAARLTYDHEGRVASQAPAARATGTTVAIRDLFRPLPVRHKVNSHKCSCRLKMWDNSSLVPPVSAAAQAALLCNFVPLHMPLAAGVCAAISIHVRSDFPSAGVQAQSAA